MEVRSDLLAVALCAVLKSLQKIRGLRTADANSIEVKCRLALCRLDGVYRAVDAPSLKDFLWAPALLVYDVWRRCVAMTALLKILCRKRGRGVSVYIGA